MSNSCVPGVAPIGHWVAPILFTPSFDGAVLDAWQDHLFVPRLLSFLSHVLFSRQQAWLMKLCGSSVYYLFLYNACSVAQLLIYLSSVS